jgi:hypothetical protein
VKLKQSTIEKFSDVLIRYGEASTIGGVATIFVENFPRLISIFGIFVGTIIVFLGLYFHNISNEKSNVA